MGARPSRLRFGHAGSLSRVWFGFDARADDDTPCREPSAASAPLGNQRATTPLGYGVIARDPGDGVDDGRRSGRLACHERRTGRRRPLGAAITARACVRSR